MKTASMLLLALLAASAALADDALPIEATVKTAIDRFERPWSPPRGSLRDWIVGIDAGPCDGAQPAERLAGDLALTAAGHLHHFVRQAGGVPVLLRADEADAAVSDQATWAARAARLAHYQCDVCVSIRFDAGGKEAHVHIAASGAQPADTQLANAVGQALAAAQATAETDASGFVTALRGALDSRVAAACVVYLPLPADGATVGVTERKHCFEQAQRLCAGLQTYCATAKRPTPPGARPAPTPTDRSAQAGDRLSRLALTICPGGQLPADQLPWFCRRFAQVAISNTTLVYFNVTAEQTPQGVELRGGTSVPAIARGLVDALAAVGFADVRNAVQTLPNCAALGDRLFGVCRVPTALTYDAAQRGGLQTQLLFGEPVFLLDATDDSYLLQGGDGYWGWVSRDVIAPLDATQFDAYLALPRGRVQTDIDGSVRIPRSATVAIARADARECVLRLPDGGTLSVPAAAVRPLDADATSVAERIRAGLALLYVPYVFGGRSPRGIDCSGLTSQLWSRTDGRLARDAWQQALAGELVATPWHRSALRAGDQVFFINRGGKVYHTGIALDATHVLHSSAPCVQIGSFDPQDPLYDEELDRDFFVAKRP